MVLGMFPRVVLSLLLFALILLLSPLHPLLSSLFSSSSLSRPTTNSQTRFDDVQLPRHPTKCPLRMCLTLDYVRSLNCKKPRISLVFLCWERDSSVYEFADVHIVNPQSRWRCGFTLSFGLFDLWLLASGFSDSRSGDFATCDYENPCETVSMNLKGQSWPAPSQLDMSRRSSASFASILCKYLFSPEIRFLSTASLCLMWWGFEVENIFDCGRFSPSKYIVVTKSVFACISCLHSNVDNCWYNRCTYGTTLLPGQSLHGVLSDEDLRAYYHMRGWTEWYAERLYFS